MSDEEEQVRFEGEIRRKAASERALAEREAEATLRRREPKTMGGGGALQEEARAKEVVEQVLLKHDVYTYVEEGD